MRIPRERIAAEMVRADLNVNQLSEKSGVSRVTISAVRAGKSCSRETAEKLAAVLGRDILVKGE